MKKAICSILSLPHSIPYAALHHETSQHFVESWIDSTKLKYFNQKLWRKESGRLFRIIRNDIIDDNKTGFTGDIEQLCVKYDLPNLIYHPLDPNTITDKCKEWSRERIWWEILTLVINSRKVSQEHYWQHFSSLMARSISLFNTGYLIFKKTCPHLIPKKHMNGPDDRSCMWRGCDGDDSYSHCRYECKFYKARFVDARGKSPVENNANYIIALNDERAREFESPTILMRTWS